MRIAVNTRLLLKDRMEGIAVFTWEICKRMVVDHPEDQFYFFFDRNPDPSFTDFKNVNPVVINPQARHPLLWNYWFEYALAKAIKKNNIDVFFSPESYLSLKSTVPMIMVTHDLSFLHYPDMYKKSHLNYFIKNGPLFHDRADHIITVSETTKNDIINQYNISKSKITVAYNAVRSKFKPLDEKYKSEVRKSISNGNRYVLYLGSIHPRKNVAGVIKGFEIWQQKNESSHQLVLFGRWAFGNADLKNLISSSSQSNRIVLKGDTDALVEDVVGAADCLVYPSFHEGFGIPIIEAMSCSVPVVTSDRGSMKEVGADAAIYIQPEDPDSIAYGINTAVHNKTIKGQKAQLAIENLKRFSWQKSAELIYERISLLNF